MAIGVQTAQPEPADSPLCVDLDGTLVRTDTLLECLLAIVRTNPFYLFRLLLTLFSGKAWFKQEVARVAALSPDSLPYHDDLLEYLRTESRRGRRILLATGADRSIAGAIAQRLGLFSGVIASDGKQNLTGARKLAAIRLVLANEPFSYVGNSRVDLEVWKHAQSAVIAGSGNRIEKEVQRAGVPIEKIFRRPRLSIRSFWRVARIHQWSKNVLVLVPIVLAHRMTNPPALLNGLRCFFAFSFCASALYVINDLFDLPMDRRHSRKRFRPIASGDLPIPAACALCGVLLAGATILTPRGDAAWLLAAYAASVITYSVYLKRFLMMDVILLAGFYTLRLLYGGAGTGITVSVWALAFSIFMFLSLALIKRISDLRLRFSEEGVERSGRAYRAEDIVQLSSLCAASGCVSGLVTILYLQSSEVTSLYSRPHLLLGIFPLLVYWQSRLLILANRGEIQEDPVVFSLFDRASRAVALAVFAVILAAI